MTQAGAGVQDAVDFAPGEDFGQLGGRLPAGDEEAGIRPLEGDMEKEAQGAGGLVGGRPGELAFFDQVQQVALHVFFGKVIGGSPVVPGKTGDGGEVGFLCAGCQTA